MQIYQVPSKPLFGVTSDFKVVWLKTGSALKPFKDKDGYKRYTYRIDGKSHHIAEHRAVAEVFVENPSKEKYKQVNHIDSDKGNNHPSNLEWVDSSMNLCHSILSGNRNVVGEKHSQTKISSELAERVCYYLSKGVTNKTISDKLDIPIHYVVNIKAGKSWRHISEKYNLVVPKKDTISNSTIEWVKHQLESGKTKDDILFVAKRIDNDKFEKIMSLILDERNDYPVGE